MKFRRMNHDVETLDPVVRYVLTGWETEPCIGATARGIYVEGYWPRFHRWQDVQEFMMQLRKAWEIHEHIARTKSPTLVESVAAGHPFPLPTEPEVDERAIQTLEDQWAKSHNTPAIPTTVVKE